MLASIRKELHSYRNAKKTVTHKNFFKHRKNDIFLGVAKPLIKKISTNHWQTSLTNVLALLKSPVHDEQVLANAILCRKFVKAEEKEQEIIFKFYLKHRKLIRDWDGVDDSAPYIVGRYLLNRDKKILYTLAKSNHLWSRRIAIVSTWWFIRNNKMKDTVEIAKMLLQDKEDLIHKATGWMLREMGKRDGAKLEKFLNTYYKIMPRTMLRYAIEKLDKKKKQYYMAREA